MNFSADVPLFRASQFIVLVLLANLLLTASALSQAPGAGRQSPVTSSAAHTADEASLARQLKEVQSKVAALEAALEKRYPGAAAKSMLGGEGMGMLAEKTVAGMGMMDMEQKKGMDAMGGDKGGMMDQQMMQMMQMMQQMMEMKMGKGMGSGMPDMKDTQSPGMKGMEMGMKGMEMGMKGREMMGGKGMAGMQTPAALPAFPGTSHIYHIGATGFFLDHPEHIKLTTEQETALNQAKEKSLLEQASFQRKIDDAEQELGTLTSSDKPDAAKIDAKVREIEKLRGDQRLAFIRSVGEAAEVLTDEQRQSLSGDAKPQEHQHNPAPTK